MPETRRNTKGLIRRRTTIFTVTGLQRRKQRNTTTRKRKLRNFNLPMKLRLNRRLNIKALNFSRRNSDFSLTLKVTDRRTVK